MRDRPAPQRRDGDYSVRFIHRGGSRRVFVQVPAYDESISAITPMLAPILAGVEHAVAALAADGSPRPRTR